MVSLIQRFIFYSVGCFLAVTEFMFIEFLCAQGEQNIESFHGRYRVAGMAELISLFVREDPIDKNEAMNMLWCPILAAGLMFIVI